MLGFSSGLDVFICAVGPQHPLTAL